MYVLVVEGMHISADAVAQFLLEVIVVKIGKHDTQGKLFERNPLGANHIVSY